MKVCTLCKLVKDESDFYAYKTRGRLYSRCKKCHDADMKARVLANPEQHSARVRAYQVKNPDRDLQTRRKYKYNIDFLAVWEAQKGLCACCGLPMQRTGRSQTSVCVDHDRTCCSGQKSCGKCVRGLVHFGCNLILGYAKDDPRIIRLVADYIERWKQSP